MNSILTQIFNVTMRSSVRLAWIIMLLLAIRGVHLNAEDVKSFGIQHAKEVGCLHIDGATGHEEKNEDRITLHYRLPPKAIVGLWTKGFPLEVNRFDELIVNMNEDSGSTGSRQVEVEVKGDRGLQKISFGPFSKRKSETIAVDWETIGSLQEIIFLIQSQETQGEITGVMELSLSFKAFPFLKKHSHSLMGKAKLLGWLSLAVFVAFGLIHLLFGVSAVKVITSAGVGSIKRDFMFGFAITSFSLLAVMAYYLSKLSQIKGNEICFLIPCLSLLVVMILHFSLIGTLLSLGGALRTVIFTGVISICVTATPIWSAPSQLLDLLHMSSLGAATVLVIFHVSNLYVMNVHQKTLSTRMGFLLTLSPFVMGLILSLQNGGVYFVDMPFTGDVMSMMTQVLLVFMFIEFPAHAFTLTTRKHLLLEWRAHRNLLILAVAVVLAPRIADIGSGAWALDQVRLVRSMVAIVTTILSQGALWAIVFVVTGIILDGIRGGSPGAYRIKEHAIKGMRNGMMYSGIFMALMQGCDAIFSMALLQVEQLYLLTFVTGGTLSFPLIKTIIESFDGSTEFFVRAKQSYRSPLLYIRGAVIGLGFALALEAGLIDMPTHLRIGIGCLIGTLAFSGVGFFNDLRSKNTQSWRSYLGQACLGSFIGAGIGFYLDSIQVPVVVNKFHLYNSFGLDPLRDDMYPLVSKWGFIQLDTYCGGAKLLFNEALKGVIGWGVGAWLFALNQSLLLAIFRRDMNHIRRIATKEGLVEICEGTIRVLRWGLWMAPVIFTFLRQMPDPTWYNQDGAFNTLLGIVMSATLSVSEFTSWRLDVFMLSMAHDSLRILTWLDHMGLRVATLVNLSFIGMEALDALMLRFTRAPQGVKNFIPEGVKRFATWAPLLIPFYIPKGKDWDVAWDTSVDIQSRSSSVWMEFLQQPVGGLLLYALGICLLLTFCLMVMRVLTNKAIVLKNEGYRVKFDQKKQRLHSSLIWQNIHLAHKEDLPRTLTIFEKGQSAWKLFGAGVTGTQVEKKKDHIVIQRESSTVNVRLEIHLPVRKDSVESWSISVKNKSSEKQVVAVAPYIEWGLDAPMNLNDHKRNVFYSAGSNAIYAEHPESGKFGFMASKFPPKGILMSKVNEMNTDQFSPPTSTKKDGEEAAVGSLLMEIELEAGEEKSIQVLMGCGHYEAEVVNFVKSYLRPKS